MTVRTLYSAISRGTEALVFKGLVPESRFLDMRAPFQEGEFPAPVKYGYINVGKVEEGPGDLLDRIVFVLYPHQRRFAVPADMVMPVPDGVPPERAVLGANMETAVNGLWDSRLGIGDRVAVIGAGVLGLLVAYLAERIPGTDVTIVDIDDRKGSVAETLGARFATPESAPADCDVVFHCSASADGLRTALRIAGRESRVVEMSWYGDSTVPAPLGEAFHSRRLTLASSQVGGIPPERAPRWSRARRMKLALTLLANPVLDVLIDGESRFEDLPDVMADLAERPGALCHRIRY